LINRYRIETFKTEMAIGGLAHALRLSLLYVLRKLLTPKVVDFDKRFGTVTNDSVAESDGGIPIEACDAAVVYIPTKPEVIRHICRTLPIDHQQYIFLDLGSGRGRALLVASDFPFKEIIGIEISPLHHRIAQENIAIYRANSQQCTAISAICENALDYSLPSDNLVIYLFQPFGTPVLRQVLRNLEETIGDRYPVFLCFAAPFQQHDVMKQHTYLQLLKSFPSAFPDDTWNLYGNELARRICSQSKNTGLLWTLN